MTPEEYKLVTGILTFLGFVGLATIVYWQFRVWPRDRQMASAMIFVLTLALVIGQLCVSYLGGPTLGTGPRGTLSYAALMLSIVWLAVETRKFNRRVLAHQKRTKRRIPPLDEPRPL